MLFGCYAHCTMGRKNTPADSTVTPDPSTLPDALPKSDPPSGDFNENGDEPAPPPPADAAAGGDEPAPPPPVVKPPAPPKKYVVRGGPEQLLYRGSVTRFRLGTVIDERHTDVAYLVRNGVILDEVVEGGKTAMKLTFVLPPGVDAETARAALQATLDQLVAG